MASTSVTVRSLYEWFFVSAASIAPAFNRPVVTVPLAITPIGVGDDVIKRLLCPAEPGRTSLLAKVWGAFIANHAKIDDSPSFVALINECQLSGSSLVTVSLGFIGLVTEASWNVSNPEFFI